MPKARRTPAFAYLRVSAEQGLGGDGFARQRDAIHAHAKVSGHQIVEEFTDGAVSGTRDLVDRPGLSALFARILENGVRVVFVENSDRLARQLIVGESILLQFQHAGVRVFTAEGFDLTDVDDPSKILVRQLLGSIAEFNKRLLVLRLKVARERIARQTGRCGGRHPFGHHPAEQPTLAAIRALRRERRSFAAIAAHLNATGAPTRTGKPWSATVVGAILTRLARRPRRSLNGRNVDVTGRRVPST